MSKTLTVGILCLSLLLSLLAGCSTKFARTDAETAHLGERTYQVIYEKYNFKQERVFDYALLEAAAIAIENDYTYFVVKKSKQSVSGGGTYMTVNAFGGMDTHSGNPKVKTELVIFLQNEKPDAYTDFYHAEETVALLMDRYDIPRTDIFQAKEGEASP
jgi:hypothetical protein